MVIQILAVPPQKNEHKRERDPDPDPDQVAEQNQKKVEIDRDDSPDIAVMTTLAEPHEYERGNYCNGIGGSLIARTSGFTFPVGHFAWQEDFRFSKIGQHHIVSRWSDDLVLSLQKALEGVKWDRFYPIRIEIKRGWESGFDTEELRHRAVLMVDIAPNTISWETAIPVALRCRDILREADVKNMEVEFRGISRQFYAMDVTLEKKIKERNLHSMTRNLSEWLPVLSHTSLQPMLSDIGYQIAPEGETPGRYGTMGLHVGLSGSPSEVYGYTCRHVAHRPTQKMGFTRAECWILDSDGYRIGDESDEAATKHRMVQMCPAHLHELRWDIQSGVKEADNTKGDLELQEIKHMGDPDRYPGLTDEEQSQLDFLNDILPFAASISGLLSQETFEEPGARAIGHIAVMPPLQVSATGFMRDWALIRLDGAKFLDPPTNKVFVSSSDARSLTMARDPELEELKSLVRGRDDRGMIRLHGTLPSASRQAHKSFGAAKYGATTGFTFGVTNEIKAVIRTPGDASDRIPAWEWIVVAPEKTKNFSAPGDSGAAVFDSQGRVMGIIGSGFVHGQLDTATREREAARRLWKHRKADDEELPADPGSNPKVDERPPASFREYDIGTDLTFVTPMDIILEDIRWETGSEMEIL